MNWNTIFDGIGTELLSLVLGGLIGGFTGYKIGIRKSSRQKQIAGNDSVQRQKNSTSETSKSPVHQIEQIGLKQYQKAGDNSNQTQIGNIDNER